MCIYLGSKPINTAIGLGLFHLNVQCKYGVVENVINKLCKLSMCIVKECFPQIMFHGTKNYIVLRISVETSLLGESLCINGLFSIQRVDKRIEQFNYRKISYPFSSLGLKLTFLVNHSVTLASKTTSCMRVRSPECSRIELN